MRQFKEILFSLSLILIFTSTNSIVTFAAKPVSKTIYDLNKGGSQSFRIENENGEIEEIVIEEIPDKTRVDGGTYHVYYKALAWTAGFYIKISDNTITSAYSPYYKVDTGSITNDTLTRNSASKATYSFYHKVAIMTYKTGVTATISNSELKVQKI